MGQGSYGVRCLIHPFCQWWIHIYQARGIDKHHMYILKYGLVENNKLVVRGSYWLVVEYELNLQCLLNLLVCYDAYLWSNLVVKFHYFGRLFDWFFWSFYHIVVYTLIKLFFTHCLVYLVVVWQGYLFASLAMANISTVHYVCGVCELGGDGVWM